jgi:predicted RNase H-like nuclease (RuvC/YqgF family)
MGTVRTISLQDNDAEIAKLRMQVGRQSIELQRREQYINELKSTVSALQSELATYRSRGKTHVLQKAQSERRAGD